jgi:3-oxoacyl-[acyl-carrier protein] reductase
VGELDGKAAIVTGSARGIGRAVAELLSEHGAKVVVNDLDADAAAAAAAEIGGETAFFAGDLTKDGAPERLVATALESFGGLDIVVNNAGYTWDGPIHKMADRQFQAMLDIHTVVPFRVLRAAAPHMRGKAKEEREEGREVFRKVVNVSSVSGVFGSAGQANYSSAKAAMIGLTKTVAKEWGGLRINSNAVAFGFVETRLTAPKEDAGTFVSDGEEIELGVSEQVLDRAKAMIPFGRAATPQEAAKPIVFLCSPWADYITGQVLPIAGGLAAGMSG